MTSVGNQLDHVLGADGAYGAARVDVVCQADQLISGDGGYIGAETRPPKRRRLRFAVDQDVVLRVRGDVRGVGQVERRRASRRVAVGHDADGPTGRVIVVPEGL